MLFEQFRGERLVPLGQRAVGYHVGEHNGCELASLGVGGGHERIKPDCVRKETTDRPE
jgi:hypothetical protein